MLSNLAKLEGILFAFGDEGVEQKQLMDVFQCDSQQFKVLIETFKENLSKDDRGLMLVKYDENFKLVTKPELHDMIGTMLTFNKNRQLSQAALETLAIIAYRQPITRLEIEEIRGVNSDMMCRRLEALDLIRETGRADSVGRPILYEVTPSFLDVFKLTTLDELPEIKLEMMDETHDFFK